MWTIIVEFTDRTPFVYGPFNTEAEAQDAWKHHTRRWSFPQTKATRITVVPMSTPIQAVAEPRPAPTFRSQPRNEVSIRREAAQIAQRKMWGES